jgi:hypothetical protein
MHTHTHQELLHLRGKHHKTEQYLLLLLGVVILYAMYRGLLYSGHLHALVPSL